MISRNSNVLWKHSSKEEVENYLEIFQRKGALSASLNYYRANIGKGKGERIGEITIPTLFVWGNRDLAIGRTGPESTNKYVKGPYTFIEIDGGHWLIQSNYEEVKTAIVEHIESVKK